MPKMKTIQTILAVGSALALAGCSSMGTVPVTGPIVTQMTPAPLPVALTPTGPTPSQATATGVQVTSTSLSDYVDPAVLPLLNSADSSKASEAVYYALQFGRAGAPWTWSGSNGTSGRITVGPFSVNNRDCRTFTHTVTVSGREYARSGSSCKEPGGTWTVG